MSRCTVRIKIERTSNLNFVVDHVNFGRYFESIRTIHGATIEELAEGICDCSLITKIESGERVSSMLVRNRLLERVGVTSDEYEKFVSVEEFKGWKDRIAIVDLVSERRCEEAKCKLERYLDGLSNNDILEIQFCFDMKAMIAKLEDDEKAVEYAEKALRKTVLLDANGLAINRKLAPKEINLIIEYSYKLGKERRYEQLLRLLQYANENMIEERNLVLFYPKLVCVYVEEFLVDYEDDIDWLMKAMKMANRAYESLSNTDRLMCVLELSNLKESIWQCILKNRGCKTSRGYEIFLESERENLDEYKLWKNLGNEFCTEMCSDDWCYLYSEEGVKCIGDIIRRRRNMIGMSAEDLCWDICSVETLERIEKLKCTPQPKRMRKLFERLGLVGEYQQTFVSVTDHEIKKCSEEVSLCSNRGDYDKALDKLNCLNQMLVEKTPEDEQFLMMTETMVKYRMGSIGLPECVKQLKRALKYTMPLVNASGNYYLRRNEINCLYNLAMVRGGDVTCEEEHFLLNLCYSMLQDRMISDIRVLEMLILAAIRIQVCKGKYDEAERLSEKLIQIELKNKRSNVLYAAFNVRILIFQKRQDYGETVEKSRIERNNYYALAMKNKQTNKETRKTEVIKKANAIAQSAI